MISGIGPLSNNPPHHNLLPRKSRISWFKPAPVPQRPRNNSDNNLGNNPRNNPRNNSGKAQTNAPTKPRQQYTPIKKVPSGTFPI